MLLNMYLKGKLTERPELGDGNSIWSPVLVVGTGLILVACQTYKQEAALEVLG